MSAVLSTLFDRTARPGALFWPVCGAGRTESVWAVARFVGILARFPNLAVFRVAMFGCRVSIAGWADGRI